nr:MAG TPA: hypothetical protein [Caudoviricetes sp.]
MDSLSIILSFVGAMFKLLIDSNKSLKEKAVLLLLAILSVIALLITVKLLGKIQ